MAFEKVNKLKRHGIFEINKHKWVYVANSGFWPNATQIKCKIVDTVYIADNIVPLSAVGSILSTIYTVSTVLHLICVTLQNPLFAT